MSVKPSDPPPALVESGPSSDTLRLARGVGASAATLAAFSVRALYGLLIARLLGGAALGVYVLAFAWADLLSQVAVFGLDTAALAYSARCLAANRPGAARQVLTRALRIAAVTSLLVASALIVVALRGDIATSDGVVRSLVVLACAIPAWAVSRISGCVARGVGVMTLDFYANGLVATALMPLGLLVAYAAGAGVVSPAIGALAGATGSALVASVAARRIVTRQPGDSGSPATSGLFGFALPIAGVNTLNLAVMRLDVMLLGYFVGTVSGVTPLALGAYAAAADIAGSFRKLRQLFDFAFAPLAVESDALRDTGALADRVGQVGRWVLLLACPAACLAALAGGALLRLYSPDFDRATAWLAVIAVATAAHGFLGLFESMLMARQPALNFGNALVAVVVQIAVSVTLIWRLGPLGAALGVTSAYGVQALLRTAEVRWFLGVAVPWRAMRTPVTAAAVALVPALVLRFLMPAPLGELAAAAVFVAIYVLGLRIVGLDPTDAALLAALRRNRQGTAVPG